MKVIQINAFLFYMLVLASCTNNWNSNIGKRGVLKDVAYVKSEVKILPVAPRKVKDQLLVFAEKMQLYTIDSDRDTIIFGNKGTRVSIPANCLVNEFGVLVKGKIQLELKELYSKKDMILANKPTVSDGKLLESNGEIYLNAKAKGENLHVSCEDGIQVMLASTTSIGMEMWLGEINKVGNINWEKTDEVLEVQNLENNSNGFVNDGNIEDERMYEAANFLFKTKKFGWINCDRFYEDTTEKVEMYVQMRNPFPKEYQTYMYVIFPEINSVLPVYSNDGENYTLSGLPSGRDIQIICLSATETKTFFDVKAVTVQKGLKASLELQPQSKLEIEKILEGL